MTGTTSRAAKIGEGDSQKGSKCSEQGTDQATAGQEVLDAAHEEAVRRGILTVPYLMALYLEYLDVREQAVGEYGEKAIQSLEDEFIRAFDARVLIRPSKRKPNPMYG